MFRADYPPHLMPPQPPMDHKITRARAYTALDLARHKYTRPRPLMLYTVNAADPTTVIIYIE